MFVGTIPVRLAEALSPEPSLLWDLSRQAGVTDAVAGSGSRGESPYTTGEEKLWDLSPLRRVQDRFAQEGLRLSVLEGAGPTLDRAKLGLPGRDEEIEQFQVMLRSMGELGIEVVCWNWMAQFGWLRSAVNLPSRGGALVTGYDDKDMQELPLTEAGEVPEEHLWETLEYFMKAVVPVAEQAGVKMALHPDDPPLARIRGMARIVRSPENMRRAIDLVPSPYNGITYCQGNFAAMDADIPATIREFGGLEQIHFVHFRDIKGSASKFEETFHDDGKTNMLEAMRTYFDIGFEGPMRPDHVPTMAGEPNDRPSYGVMGRLFALGYMKGLMEAVAAERAAGAGAA
ncbi:MAG TPA: mannonate dehydratase [Candidatus Dormibacteraeota bacterium]|jgi:mannonate dehydratase|nr:mannonate dehydratase [Candidatus Dormibacteraeota bacterium]